jgi:predicted O-linked N-acetylglucosamine transferase (SPINDLY family)
MMEKNGIATTRLHLVGPFPHDAYLSLNLACDVFLDAHGWSGGNTTLEALRTNLPIVTTPGEFMRGRHSTAILEQIGLKHFVADNQDDWIKKAIQYAKDESLRVAHAAQISDASQLAYRDPKTVEALGREMTKLYQDL